MNKVSFNFSAFCRRPARFVIGSGKQSKKNAFTLIEILVSVTVLSLMILFLFSVFNLASQAWQSSEKKVDAFREARAALFVMRRDLSGMQVETELPMALNQGLVPNLSTLANSVDQLFLLSTLNPDMQGGNSASGELCSVGYYVSWAANTFATTASGTNNAFASQSYNLFRYFRTAETNFSNLRVFWTNFSVPSSLQQANLQNLYAEARPVPFTGDEVLARNVIGFRIRPYYWRVVETVVAGVTNTNSVLSSTNTGSASDAVVFTNKPAFVDVSMTVINYATAGQLGNSAAQWNQRISDSNPNSIVNQNKQEFYMRVPLTP